MVAFQRFGDCCQCGDCCKGNPYTGEDPHLDCPHLVRTNETSHCDIHGTLDTYWAKGCNVWPTIPEHVAHLERCTYTFRLVELVDNGC
jgi:hypothetical protein